MFVGCLDEGSAKYSMYLKFNPSGRSAIAAGVDLLNVAFSARLDAAK